MLFKKNHTFFGYGFFVWCVRFSFYLCFLDNGFCTRERFFDERECVDPNDFVAQLGGELSPANAVSLLDMMNGAEITELLDDMNAPEETADEQAAESVTEETTQVESKKQPETPPVIDENQALRDEVAALKAQMAQWQQAQAQPKVETEPPSVADKLPEAAANLAAESGLSEEELAALFGDFSEKELATGIQKLIDLKVETRVMKSVDERFKSVDERLNQALSPLQQREQETAEKEHFAAILAAHPDADKIAAGNELSNWVQAQPSFMRVAIEQVLKQGTAQEVIDVLTSFKQATAKPEITQPETAKAESAAADKGKANVPNTLSDKII